MKRYGVDFVTLEHIDKKKGEIISSIYFFFLFLVICLDSTGLNRIGMISLFSKGSKALVALLLISLIIFLDKSLKRRIVSFFLFALTVVNFFYTKEIMFMIFFLFVLASQHLDFFEFIKKDFRVRSFYLVIVIALFLLGITNDVSMWRGESTRYALGMGHPNTLATYVFVMILEYLLIKSKFLNYKHIAVSAISGLLMFYVTGSRTATYTLIIIFFLLIVNKYFNVFSNKIVSTVILLSPILMSVVSFLVARFGTYSRFISSSLNNLTSGRMYYFSNLFNNYGLSLWGRVIPELDKNISQSNDITLEFLDNAYLSLMIVYGVIMLALYISYFTTLQASFIKDHNKYLMILLLAFLIYGFFENTLLRAEFSIFCMAGANSCKEIYSRIKNISKRKIL
jgi:hypothetical protein